MRTPPTPQQEKCLQVIRELIARNGFSPSYAEIAERCGRRQMTIKAHIDELVDKGYLTCRQGQTRSIRIVE